MPFITIRKTWYIVLVVCALLMMRGTALAAEKWVACGDDQLLFYALHNGSMRETDRLAWSDLDIPWEFSDSARLDGMVECKPVNQGQSLLVASWKGDVARVDLAGRKVDFSAQVPHAHSADLLPDNRIAFVGNRLRVFDADNGKTPLIDIPLDDGHGIRWDQEKNILYVLSEDYMEEFALEDWNTPSPKLKPTKKTGLPGKSDGHDLAVTDDGMFLVSTRDGVWIFTPESRQFAPYPELNPVYRAQSVAGSGDSVVWVQAEESWWGRGFFVRTGSGPVQRISTPALRVYKARRLAP